MSAARAVKTSRLAPMLRSNSKPMVTGFATTAAGLAAEPVGSSSANWSKSSNVSSSRFSPSNREDSDGRNSTSRSSGRLCGGGRRSASRSASFNESSSVYELMRNPLATAMGSQAPLGHEGHGHLALGAPRCLPHGVDVVESDVGDLEERDQRI